MHTIIVLAFKIEPTKIQVKSQRLREKATKRYTNSNTTANIRISETSAAIVQKVHNSSLASYKWYMSQSTVYLPRSVQPLFFRPS